MKKSIIRRITLVTLSALALFTACMVFVVSALNKRQAKSSVTDILSVIEKDVADNGLGTADYARLVEQGDGSDIRVTVIGLDGKVIADTVTDSESLENHKERPEIKAALDGGTGTDIRRSESVKIRYIYAARKAAGADGDIILRAAVPVASVNTYLWAMVGIMAAVVAAVLLITVPLASSAADTALKPIAMIKAKLDTVGKPEDMEMTLTRYDEINQVLIEIYEISERLNAKIIDADRMQKERQEFFVNASHELNTPLSSVLGYAELLKKEGRYNNDFVETICRQSERMKALIGDMLKLSQLEEGKEIRDERLGLKALCEETVASFKPKAAGKEITLSGRFEELFIFADKEKITEIVSNLIDNSIKYTKSGGRVDVTLKEKGGRAQLTVKDNGMGIAQKHLGRITERFYRTDVGRSRAEGGTGLGLAIVKHICNHYNAPLTIKSAEGAGTEITVSFALDKTL